MTKIGFAVAVLVGCGAKPAEPLEKPTPLTPNELQLSTPVPHGPVRAFADRGKAATMPRAPGPGELVFPRPALETTIDPPDVNELGRWPLTLAEHPALEPHFDVAAALAEPGMSWTDLCSRGAQHRHLATHQELVDYLDAWCTAITGNYSETIVKLGHLRTTPNARLVRELKFDVAALAAAHGLAHDLESFLRDGGFLDVEQVDLVAAAYFEIGKLDDAAEANRLAEMMDHTPTETDDCTRRLRAIADASSSARDEAIDELRYVASPPPTSSRAPHCRAQFDVVRCWKDHDCLAYWRALGAPGEEEGLVALARVYERWDRNYAGYDWNMAAKELVQAFPLRDRYRLLVPAVDLALRTVDCTPDAIGNVETIAEYGIDDLGPPRAMNQLTIKGVKYEHDRLAELAKLTPGEITAFRFRLEATLTEAQHLFPLGRSDCTTMRARLPPVQP